MTAQSNVLAALAANPLLEVLDDSDRELLASFMETMSVSAGEVVIREGATDRVMYFLVEGEARVKRGALDLGGVRQGEHFGELGLMAERRRSASIEAGEGVVLARLTVERFEALARENPGLALRLLRAVVASLGQRLTEMNESFGMLLHERSLPRRTKVKIQLNGERHEVRTGTPASELLPEEIDGRPVVGAFLDNRPVALVTPLSSDGSLAPLTTGHWEGTRVYRDSLGLLTLEAAHRLQPELTVKMGQSVGFAQRVRVEDGDGIDTQQFATDLQAQMEALVAENLPLQEEWWQGDEARAFFREAGWRGASEALRSSRSATCCLVTYGSLYAPRPGLLVDNTGMLAGFRVMADGDNLLVVYPPEGQRRVDPDATDGPSEQKVVETARTESRHTDAMTSEHRRWLQTLGITSVGEFNKACIYGEVSRLIRVAEGFQEKRIGQIADLLQARAGTVKAVVIAGPSSSGKTTFIKRLSVQLQVNGMQPQGLGLDDYYVDREQTPRDASGEYDFEAFEAIRSDLLQEHLARLRKGETVRTAYFDFSKGKSHPEGGRELTLGKRDVLMLEGIHGLNPKLLRGMPEESIFRVFVSPLAQLRFDRLNRVHPSDVRLIRRIVRDRHHRNLTAADNINRWPSVRRGERRNIFPNQGYADAVFDSSLIYELSVLKVYAERYLLEVPPSDPAYATAFRLLQLLGGFVTIYPDHVPPNSILREFVGGSGFEY